jgi:hypothetical protein
VELPPYCLISVTASARYSSQPRDGSTTRGVPSASQKTPRLEIVDDLDGRGRVVDRGGERSAGDVDHHADGEGRILLDRALLPEGDHPFQIASGVRGWGEAPDLEEGRLVVDEIAHAVMEHERARMGLRPAHETLE